MYNAKIVTDSGITFNFGYEYDSVFDIDPLTGVDVDLATSQGYLQIGETVEGQSVGGVNRTIKGVFFKNEAEREAEMLNALPMFTTGKLYYNDNYFCDMVVKKTPVIVTNKVGITSFSILVFCYTPFWLKAEKNVFELNSTSAVNCKNEGVAQMEFSVKFETSLFTQGFGIKNTATDKFIKLNTDIEQGESVTVYRKNGRLYVLKNDTEDIFAALDEDSNLFELASGDNELIATADGGETSLTVTVEFYEPYMGVINAKN